MDLLVLGTGAIVGIAIAGVVVFLLLVALIWGIASYNSFVKLDSQCDEAFSTMDVYLKKRYDLIPNIVNTVKGYAAHESEVLEKVVQARSNAQAAKTAAEKLDANVQLSGALRSLNMVAENYPDLKANTNFMNLQNQLSSIEGEIANSRKYYNAVVKTFNTKIRSIPANIVANMMKLEKKPYFEIDDEAERQNVKVEF